MTAMNQTVTQPTAFNPKVFIRVLAAAAAGVAAGYGLMQLVKLTGLSFKMLSGFDVISLSLGLGFVAMGLTSAILASNRRRLAQALESACDPLFAASGEEAKLPATDAEVRTALTQAAVLGLAGILMLIPIFTLAPVHAHPGLGIWIFPGVFVVFLLQSALNLQLWQASDEFLRKTILSVCAGSFVVSQGLLFLWATAERLHLVAAATSWEIFTLMMACYMVASFAVARRVRR
jgi:hypothetical protein